jgi:hypothetical protein
MAKPVIEPTKYVSADKPLVPPSEPPAPPASNFNPVKASY